MVIYLLLVQTNIEDYAYHRLSRNDDYRQWDIVQLLRTDNALLEGHYHTEEPEIHQPRYILY